MSLHKYLGMSRYILCCVSEQLAFQLKGISYYVDVSL